MTCFHPALLLAPLVLLPGCLATQSGSLEVLNPDQAYGRTLAIVDDVHGENTDIEKRLASDLQKALAKRGLPVAGDPAKAEIVIVPTLGRMRDRTPNPVAVAEEESPVEAGGPVESAEPVVAAPAPETRPFHRFTSAHGVTRGDLLARRAVPSARAPEGAQQAGLLLTGFRGEDFRDYGTGRQSLPPVWRIYVSQPAVQMKWNSVAMPLINAAAAAAKPLGGGNTRRDEEKVKKKEGKVESERESEEKAEPRVADGQLREKTKKEKGKVKSESDEKAEPREKKKKSGEQGAGSAEQEMEREEKEKKKKPVFRFFGGFGEKSDRAPEGNGSRTTGDRPE